MASSENTPPDRSTPPTQGRVRWRRFAAIMLPSAAAAAALLGLTAQGVLASSFSVSGQQFKVSADSLIGTGGFQQFGSVDHGAGSPPALYPVAVSEIGSAKLVNLCQSVVTNFPFGLGAYTLTITAGGGATAVSATNLVVDATQLSGDASFGNINIGQDASTLNAVPGVPAGQAGTFGQQASTVTIDNLHQTAYATSAGTFTLPGFGLKLAAGDHPCF